jgi:hypothetical protein
MNEVREGQLWQDNDKRLAKDGRVRYVRVIQLIDSMDAFTHQTIRKARCEAWYDEVGSLARTVHINVERFRPNATGYRLIEDVAADGAA